MKSHSVNWLPGIVLSVVLLGSVSASAGGWKYVEEHDPIYGSDHTRISKFGKGLNYDPTPRPSIIVTCEKNDEYSDLIIDINWRETIAEPNELIPVITRIDENQPITKNWHVVVRGRMTALDSYRSNPYPLLESMLTAKIMYARVIFEGIRRDVKFDLTGFAESVRPVIDACPKENKSEKPA